MRGPISGDLNSIHIKPFPQKKVFLPSDSQNKPHPVSYNPRPHEASLFYKNENISPAACEPLESSGNHEGRPPCI